MTEVQLAKLTIKISELKSEVEQSEAKANFDEREFADAWRQYGSELAGPPSSIEINRNKAKEFRRKADFLERARIGKITMERLAVLKERISLIDEQIATLNSSKMTMYEELSLMRYLEEVIK